MAKAKRIFIILAVCLGLILSILNNRLFSDDAGDPYSDEPETNIGAWYDETWQASGFYRLEQFEETDDFCKFRYEHTTTPTTTSNPTFVKDSASLPQDIVITEWRVTGHVHFSSGL